MKTKTYFLSLLFGIGAPMVPVLSLAATSNHTSIESGSMLTNWIKLAIERDASRLQMSAQAQSIQEAGVASSTLMDPKLKFGVGGMPVDSFKFGDDPATNVSVSLMQQFSRGDTLRLQQQKADYTAQGLNWSLADRERVIAKSVTNLWLELAYAQKAQAILLSSKTLMSELERDISSNYALGKTETQDVLNAELQVARLDEKLQANRQLQQRIQGQLSEWLGDGWLLDIPRIDIESSQNWQSLDALFSAGMKTNYYQELAQHPMLKAIDSVIAGSQTQISIAEQSYKPEFGVEVMYAYRQGNNMKGEPASDLVSAYLTVDLPLFTDKRQDRMVSAAKYNSVAAKSNKDLVLVQMNSRVNTLLADRVNLSERKARYDSVLIKQAQARTKAVERGYENNTARLVDYIAASNEELTLDLERWRLATDLNKSNSELAYLLNRFDFNFSSIELPSLQQSPTRNK
jgi:outer membrane protein TolC